MRGCPHGYAHVYPQILWIRKESLIRAPSVSEFTSAAGKMSGSGLCKAAHEVKVRTSFAVQELRVFSIIEAAGWPIWFLLLASVISVALIIERFLALRRSKIVPAGLLIGVVNEYRQSGVNEERLNKLELHSPLGRVLAAGVRNARNSREVMKESIEEAGRGVAHELERFLTTLGTIASISPLMGLFGTIVGMIEIFGSATAAGNNPQMLAHGISVALYNTGFGLIIAIPSMIFYRHFRAEVDSLLVEMELQAVKLVEMIHGDRK